MRRALMLGTALAALPLFAGAAWAQGEREFGAAPTNPATLRPSIVNYGAICDGTSHPLSNYYATLAAAQLVYPNAVALTDEIDGTAIQAAINDVGAHGKGLIWGIGGGTCLVSQPLTETFNDVGIDAPGKAGMPQATDPVAASGGIGPMRVKYTGTATASPLMRVGPVQNLVSGKRISGVSIRNVVWDANNLAATAFAVYSTWSSRLEISARDGTVQGILFDTIGLNETNDTQMNTGWLEVSESVAGGDGIVIDGSARNNGTGNNGNTAFNRFDYFRIVMKGGASTGRGLVWINSDSNYVGFVDINTNSPTSNCVEFDGDSTSDPAQLGAHVNRIGFLSAPSCTIIAKGTSSFTRASKGNVIDQLDTANSTSIPTLETGATLFWADSTFERLNMGDRAVNNQIAAVNNSTSASGQFATIAGGNVNTASGQYSTVTGGGDNVADGDWSEAGGRDVRVQGRRGVRCWASLKIASPGDAQICEASMKIATSATSAATFTTDGSAPSNTTKNCWLIPDNTADAMTILVEGYDTTNKNSYSALFNIGELKRGAGVATTSWGGATTPSSTFNSGLVPTSLTAGADTGRGCLALVVTPANTDLTHWTARVVATEVQ